MKKLLMTAGAAVLALSTAASAATLSITGGVAGSVSIADGNDALSPLGLGDPLAGFFESSITASGIGPANSVFVEVMGYEAGFLNTFSTAEDSYTSPGGTDFSGPLASWVTDVQAGLNFTFSTSGPALTPTVSNGDPNQNLQCCVNFFAHDSGDGYIWLFLDDGGGQHSAGGPDDDNHDDLVVRLSIVPLPAGAVLLLTGLGALVLRRRLS